MAIVQVSRITSRKGLYQDLPQLYGGEFGWCIDQRRLFIGNGTLQEGAPVIGNTEILTQFSDITTLSQYTYKDSVVGYTAQTGPTSNNPVVRTVQAKLDDFADVRDFGAMGDGIADDTDAINRALAQLYCQTDQNPMIRRTLYFPAGTYRVSDTIKIPTYAKLVGEGADCSIIYLDPADSSVPDYVARFADSKQQVGAALGTNGATLPRNIEISSLTFQTAIITDVMLVDTATQVYFDSVNFRGPLDTADIINNLGGDDIAGIRFNSGVSVTTNQVTVDKCRFVGLTYGINTSVDLQAVTVSNSAFFTLYQGIIIGDPAPSGIGPTGFRAVHNMFDMIYESGIVYGTVDLNVTAHNIFYNVGNEFSNNPYFSIIRFGNDNNVSISDMFERDDTNNDIVSRISVTGGNTTNTSLLQVGHYARGNGKKEALAITVPDLPVFQITTQVCRAFRMDYTIISDSTPAVRTGTFIVTARDTGDSALTISYNDDYTENEDTGVILSAVQSTDTITVQYTNSGSTAELTYSLAYLA